MTEADTPDPPATPATVRAAAQALKDAVDAHLGAVEARTGELDPAVQAAFDALQAAAEDYDDALFEVYEEVTPFEVSGAEEEGGPGLVLAPEDAPQVVSLFVRRDYALANPQQLMAAGREAQEALAEEDGGPQEELGHLGGALYEILRFAGVDGLDAGAEEAGLEPLGGTVWFVAAQDEERADVSPFAAATPERLIYRIDEVVGDG